MIVDANTDKEKKYVLKTTKQGKTVMVGKPERAPDTIEPSREDLRVAIDNFFLTDLTQVSVTKNADTCEIPSKYFPGLPVGAPTTFDVSKYLRYVPLDRFRFGPTGHLFS